ncbi:MAG: SDR family oxidoreductase [Propionibacteriaceae bacterium]
MTTSTHNTTNSSTIALITGANKGLGFETARRLGALGWTVWLGARDPELGQTAADKLATDGSDVRFVRLDVTDDASVAGAVETIQQQSGRVDVLVNNAGISGTLTDPVDTDPTEFLGVFGVNLLGPVRVTKAFLPLLRGSSQPRIVMVSSGLGSFGITTDPERFESTIKGLVYPASKAALNMVTTMYAKSLPGFQVNAVDPGYTATDLNGHSGPQTVEQGTDAIVRAATLAADGATGTFSEAAGPIPW